MIFKNETDNIINHKMIESQEQRQAEQYIKSDSIVLELGARYGTVSCIINKKLSIKTNQVSVEPDILVHKSLEENMKNNNCDFHILKGIISKKNMELTGAGYGTTSISCETKKLDIYTLEEVEEKYNLKFNTLVADCEGFLEQFFDENPKLYDQLDLCIFEQDYSIKCNYKKIIDNLTLYNFKQLERGYHQVWIKNK
jgi:FkbM family methyltransferase